MTAALSLELRKLLRSRVVQVGTALPVLLVPLLALLVVRAAGADGVGMLAGKADALVSGEGWDGYLGGVRQVAAAALFVGSGVVVAWVFGREHADRTFGALFAMPVSRASVAVAKLVVVAAWALVVALAVTAVTVALGAVADVDPAHALPAAGELLRLVVVAASTMLLTTPVALVASVGRGYLPAVGAVVVLLATAQVSVFLGAGAWFPFAVPGLLAVADGEVVAAPGAGPWAVVALTVLAGAAATVAWWRHAEVV